MLAAVGWQKPGTMLPPGTRLQKLDHGWSGRAAAIAGSRRSASIRLPPLEPARTPGATAMECIP